ncbi:hypothetical protein V7147_04980, partial [Bacillus sp. JJ1521]|uniref:hypothetical protein n=1 Tax=Bacillus sp. JJ1521 TaxID=3122957 RepID=UPI002FFF7606
LNKVKASGGCHRFSNEIFRDCTKKSGHKYANAYLIKRSTFCHPTTPRKKKNKTFVVLLLEVFVKFLQVCPLGGILDCYKT